MQFLNAVFLWAGFAVLIPPIIHLFNFRRYKTVYFSDVRFLQNLKNITRQRSTLRQIVLMILRMLVIAALVLAFAEPVWFSGNASSSKSRKSAPPIIYIDNSFSMQAGAMSGLNLQTAKSRALQIVDAFPRGTDFLFITNDFSQRHNHLVNSDGIRLFLQDLDLSPRVPTLSQVIDRAVKNLCFQDVDPESDRVMFAISDFQRNICDVDKMEADSLLTINLVGVVSSQSPNVSVDTLEFRTPFRMNGTEEEVAVTVTNHSDKPVNNIPIRLSINNQTKVSESISLSASERRQVLLRYVNTVRSKVLGVVSISDFPIDYDNDLYFSYNIDSIRNVLVIGGSSADNKYIRALVGKDPNFDIREASCSDDFDFQDYQAVVLNQLGSVPHDISAKVQQYVALGGNVVFIPSFDGDIDSYNYLLSLMECNGIVSRDTIKCKVSTINAQSILLRNAVRKIPDNPDLPVLQQYFNSMSNSYQGEEVVLESDSYKKVLTTNQYRAGRFHVFYTPLSDKAGTFATHRLIVPVLYNAISMSSSFGKQYYSVIGRDDGYPVKLGSAPDFSKIFLRSQDSDNEFIPRVSGPDAYMNYKIFSENCVEKSGFMHLLIENSEAEAIAYNYDRKESSLDFMDPGQVQDLMEQRGFMGVNVMDAVDNTLERDSVVNSSARPLWKIFIVLALVFAAAEIAVARFL